MSDRVHTRIDPQLKQDVSVILSQLGLSEGDAVRMFYKQIQRRRGLPFEVRIPNETTLDAFAESDDNATSLRRFESFHDFRSSLEGEN